MRSELAYANSDSTSEPTPPKGGSDDPLRGSFARTRKGGSRSASCFQDGPNIYRAVLEASASSLFASKGIFAHDAKISARPP